MKTMYRTNDIFNFGNKKTNQEALLICKAVAMECGLNIGKCYTDKETHSIYKLHLYGSKKSFLRYYYKTRKINISYKDGLTRLLHVLKWS